MSKISLIVAGSVGYVLGARAGKDRYADIKSKATQLWQDPRVQEKKDQAQNLVKEKAPAVQGKVADVAAKASSKSRASGGTGDGGDVVAPAEARG